MTIKDIDEFKSTKPQIDLTGPQGNAFVLLGLARRYAKIIEKDLEAILERMTSGDYEKLVEVFEQEFGDYVILYR